MARPRKSSDVTYEIEIRNFKKYNPRKDLKSMTWYRVESNMFSDHEFCGLSSSGKLLWYYLLAKHAQKNTSKTVLKLHLIAKEVGLRTDFVQRGLKQLEEIQWVTVRTRTKKALTNSNTDRSTTRTDRTESKAPSKKQKPKSREISPLEELSKHIALNAEVKKMLKNITSNMVQKWLTRYYPESVELELNKAHQWVLDSKAKKKSWTLFFDKWLAKSAKKKEPSRGSDFFDELDKIESQISATNVWGL